jgi:hypothetical protein
MFTRPFLPGPGNATLAITIFAAFFTVTVPNCGRAEWPQFRGPDGLGRSDDPGLPLTWNDTNNVVWKSPLPGPGASSPIVHGTRAYLTCFTGFATSSREPGEMTNLKRHLLCINLADGRILWNTAVSAEMPEQDRIRENHGYASSTPVTDGELVYTFFGRSGVIAFDLDGTQVWQASVGSKLNGWGWYPFPIVKRGSNSLSRLGSNPSCSKTQVESFSLQPHVKSPGIS